jgi:hypothetical protein
MSQLRKLKRSISPHLKRGTGLCERPRCAHTATETAKFDGLRFHFCKGCARQAGIPYTTDNEQPKGVPA